MEIFLPEPAIPSWDLLVKRKEGTAVSESAEEIHTGAAFLKGGTKKITDQSWTTHVSIPLTSKSTLKDTIVFRIMKQSSLTSKRKPLLESSFAVSELVPSHLTESINRTIPDGKGGSIMVNFTCETTSPKMWWSTLRKAKSADTPQGSADIDAFIKELEVLVSEPQYRTKFLQYVSQKSDVVPSLYTFFEHYATQLESIFSPTSSSSTASPGKAASSGSESSKKSHKRVSRKQEVLLEQAKVRLEALNRLISSLLKDAHSRKPFLDADYLQKVIAWACTEGLSSLAAAGLASLKPLFATEPQQESLGRAGIIHVLIHLLNPTSTYGARAPLDVTTMAMQLLPYFSNRFHSVFIKAGIFDCVELLLASTTPSSFQRGMELILMISATKTEDILTRFLPIFTGTLARLATQIQVTHASLTKFEPPNPQTNLSTPLTGLAELLQAGRASTVQVYEKHMKPKTLPPITLDAPFLPSISPALVLPSLINTTRSTKKKAAPPIDTVRQEDFRPSAPPKPLPARERNAVRIETLSRQVGRMLDDPNADDVEVATLLSEIEKLSADEPEAEERKPLKPLVDREVPDKILPIPASSQFVGLLDAEFVASAGAGEISAPSENSDTSELQMNDALKELTLDLLGAPVPQAESPPATDKSVSTDDLDALLSLLNAEEETEDLISRAINRWGPNGPPDYPPTELDSSDDEEPLPAKSTNVLRTSRDVRTLMDSLDQIAATFTAPSSSENAENEIEAAVASFAAPPPPPPLPTAQRVNPVPNFAAVLAELVVEPAQPEPLILEEVVEPAAERLSPRSEASPRTNTSSSTSEIPSSGASTPSREDKVNLRLQMAELERSVLAPLQPISRLAKGHEEEYLKHDVIPSLITIMRYCLSTKLKGEVQSLITQIVGNRDYDLQKHNYIDAVLSMAVSACAAKPEYLNASVPAYITQALGTLSKPGLVPTQHQLLELARLLRVPQGWFAGLYELILNTMSKWDVPKLFLLAPPLLLVIATLPLNFSNQGALSLIQRAFEPLVPNTPISVEQALLATRLLRYDLFMQRLLGTVSLTNCASFLAMLRAILAAPSLSVEDAAQYDAFVSQILLQENASESPPSFVLASSKSKSTPFALVDVLEGSIAHWRLTLPAIAAQTHNLGTYLLLKLLNASVYDETHSLRKKELLPIFKDLPYVEPLIRSDPDCFTMTINSDYNGGFTGSLLKMIATLPADIIALLVNAGFGRVVLRKLNNKPCPKEEVEGIFQRMCTDGNLWRVLIRSREVADAIPAITNSTSAGEIMVSHLSTEDAEFFPTSFFESLFSSMTNGTMRSSTIAALATRFAEIDALYQRLGSFGSSLQDAFIRLYFLDYGHALKYPREVQELAKSFLHSDRAVKLAQQGFFARTFRLLSNAAQSCSFGQFLDALIEIDSKQGYRLLRATIASEAPKPGARLPSDAEAMVLSAISDYETPLASGDWLELPGDFKWDSVPPGSAVAIVAFRGDTPVCGGVIPSLPAVERVVPKAGGRALMAFHNTFQLHDPSARIFYLSNSAKPTSNTSSVASLGLNNVNFNGAMNLSWDAPSVVIHRMNRAYSIAQTFPAELSTDGITRCTRYAKISSRGVSNICAAAAMALDSKDAERTERLISILIELAETPGGATLVDSTAQEIQSLFAGTVCESAAEDFYERLCAPGFALSTSWRSTIGGISKQVVETDEATEVTDAPPQLRALDCIAAYSESRGLAQVVAWTKEKRHDSEASSAPNSESSSSTLIPDPPGKEVPIDLKHDMLYTHGVLSVLRSASTEETPDSVALFLSEDPLPQDEIFALAASYSSSSNELSWPVPPAAVCKLRGTSNAESSLLQGSGLLSFPTPLRANHILAIALYDKKIEKSTSAAFSLALLGSKQQSVSLSMPRLNHILKFFKNSTISSTTHVGENEVLQGIVYQIGCNFGRRPWQSPVDDGLVNVKLSHKLNAHTMNVSAVVGRDSEVTFWGPGLPCWFQVDLLKYSACPTHLSLRHGYDFDNSYIHNWQLQASHDADTWTEIFRCHEVSHTSAFGITLYPITTPCTQFYRFWRVITFSEYWMPPSGVRNAFLCCSGFDLFGHVISS